MTFHSFLVRGLPAPQGSKRAIVNRFSGRAALIESSARVKPWRADIREAATTEMRGGAPSSGPLSVSIAFVFPRPKSHFGSGRNASIQKESAPKHHTGKPDLDKLARAALDAMTGIVYLDDAQIVQLHLSKRYPGPGDGPVAASGGMTVTWDA